MTRLTYYHYDLDGKLIAGTRAGSVRVAVVGTDPKPRYAAVMLPDDDEDTVPDPFDGKYDVHVEPRPREKFTPQGILIEDPPMDELGPIIIGSKGDSPRRRAERAVIEAAREWAIRPGVQRRIDALTDALEALERAEGE